MDACNNYITNFNSKNKIIDFQKIYDYYVKRMLPEKMKKEKKMKIICAPPASGKTTYIKKLKSEGYSALDGDFLILNNPLKRKKLFNLPNNKYNNHHRCFAPISDTILGYLQQKLVKSGYNICMHYTGTFLNAGSVKRAFEKKGYDVEIVFIMTKYANVIKRAKNRIVTNKGVKLPHASLFDQYKIRYKELLLVLIKKLFSVSIIDGYNFKKVHNPVKEVYDILYSISTL